MSTSRKTLIIVLSLGILLSAGFTIARLKNQSITATDEDQVDIATPTPTTKVIPTVKIGDCRSSTLGIVIAPPTGWECRVEDDKVSAEIVLKADLLTVTISNSGRSGPCEPPEYPTETPSCLPSPIYENNIITLNQYRDNGTTTEIFGTFKDIDDKYFFVSYDEMFQRDLSATEKVKLTSLVESIVLEKAVLQK